MHLHHPFQIDGTGRTAGADDAAWLRGLIEQVLFTRPGERVNRPDFGSGLLHLAFTPLSEELRAATEFLVRSSLQQWLGHLLTVERVEVSGEDATLRVSVGYTVARTGERRLDVFQPAGVPG